MTPADYRKGGAGERIEWTIVSGQLGRMLVAATDRGICAVSLGADDEALIRDLHREFPAAECVRADHELSETAPLCLTPLNEATAIRAGPSRSTSGQRPFNPRCGRRCDGSLAVLG